jgi:hypothetical protein
VTDCRDFRRVFFEAKKFCVLLGAIAASNDRPIRIINCGGLKWLDFGFISVTMRVMMTQSGLPVDG